MDINPDATILKNLRVDPSYEAPIQHQALRIAVYHEMVAYETYMKVIETFGEIAPFVQIVEAQKQHYMAMQPLLEKYGVELPINDYSSTIQVPQTLLECCEQGVVAEQENIKMYDNLIMNTQEYPDIQELFFRLQAASYNNHLPAFRQCVQAIYAQASGTNAHNEPAQNPLANMDAAMSQLDELSQTAEKFSKGQFSQDELMKLLSNKNFSFMGGALLGAVGAMMFAQSKDKNSEEGE